MLKTLEKYRSIISILLLVAILASLFFWFSIIHLLGRIVICPLMLIAFAVKRRTTFYLLVAALLAVLFGVLVFHPYARRLVRVERSNAPAFLKPPLKPGIEYSIYSS